jgi:serine/threonine protein kinase
MQKGRARSMRTDHLLNQTIAGYDLVEVLGRGGMSIVFLAQRIENPRERVAIKMLIPSAISTGEEATIFKARFLREARTVHQLHHPHILPILDYGEDEANGLFYMIMPVISGGNLSRRLALHAGGLPLEEVDQDLEQLAGAVDYSNQHGVVHRDIKPSNVLLDETGKVYLADFGIVRLFDSSHLALDDAPPTLTTTGKLYGTPAYMAPERFRGEPAEPATDIYALGVLLYQLVTGQVPFEADNPLAVGLKHLNEEPLRPRSLRPDLPEAAEAAILKALAKEPAERFTSASALSSAFHAGLTGQWAEELLPFAAVLAAQPLNAPALSPAPLSPLVLSDETEPYRFIADPAPQPTMDNLPLADVPTAVNTPVAARRQPHFWRNLQVGLLALLVAVVLVLGGLLALAAYKFATPPQQTPGPAVPATGTASNSATPTQAGVTPAATTGAAATASAGSTPSPAAGQTPTTPAGAGGTTPVTPATPAPATPTPEPQQPTPAPTQAPPEPTSAATPSSAGTP